MVDVDVFSGPANNAWERPYFPSNCQRDSRPFPHTNLQRLNTHPGVGSGEAALPLRQVVTVCAGGRVEFSWLSCMTAFVFSGFQTRSHLWNTTTMPQLGNRLQELFQEISTQAAVEG